MNEWVHLHLSTNYSINKLGEVRNNRTETILKHSTNRYGYTTLNLWINGKKKTQSLHRALAIAFIPNPENKRCVNHINGNKSDNRIENLEWATDSENQKHSYNTGLSSKPLGIKNPFNKWSEVQILKIKELLKQNKYTHREISEIVKTTKYVVDDISCGKAWTHL